MTRNYPTGSPEHHAAAAFLNGEHETIADAARYYDCDDYGVEEWVRNLADGMGGTVSDRPEAAR